MLAVLGSITRIIALRHGIAPQKDDAVSSMSATYRLRMENEHYCGAFPGEEHMAVKCQSRKASFIESATSTAVGYLIALCGQMVLYPLLNIPVTLAQNLFIGAVFTALAVARSYVLRRAFEWLRVSGVLA